MIKTTQLGPEMIDNIDKGYEAFLKVTNLKDTFTANIKYTAYLKFKAMPIYKAIFADDEQTARAHARKAMHGVTEDRIRNLLSPHALTLYQASIKQDGWLTNKYHLIKHLALVGLPVFVAIAIEHIRGRFT